MVLPIIFLSVAQLATAHFGVNYPEWRADTLENEDKYSQWDYPCGGVPESVSNRTDWPLTGGSVSLALHHPWTYVFVNLGLGTNVSNFNVSLTPDLVNVTGKGDFCFPLLPLSLSVSDGTNATIQFVTSGESGSALYNCADITLRSSAKPLAAGDALCKNVTGITAAVITEGSSSNSSSKDGSAAPVTVVNIAALTTAVGLAVAFAAGMSL